MPSRQAVLLYREVLHLSCCVQGVLSILEVALVDPLRGLADFTVTALGLQAASPRGHGMLPGYIFFACCNGAAQAFLSLDPHAAGALAAGGSKAALAASLASPVVMLASVVAAWGLHRELAPVQLVLPGAEDLREARAQAELEEEQALQRSFGFCPFGGPAYRLRSLPSASSCVERGPREEGESRGS